MKKLAAIVLLFLLLFNLAGYKLWFYYVQAQSEAQLASALDKQLYNDGDLITLQIPLSLPYQTDQKDFERVDGEINLNGQVYKYVKRRVYQGKLILLCLPDHAKMQLETAKDDFFKLANSLQPNAPVKKPISTNSISLNSLSGDYDDQLQEWILHTYTYHLTYAAPVDENSFIDGCRHPLEQPPDSHIV